jgi:hypothetical protein
LTWVDDRIYAAGGAHIPATWGSFAEQTGILAVLHLCPGRPADFRGLPARTFLWLNVESEAEAGESERWLAAEFIAGCLAADQAVLIHSSLGRHRVRWAYVAYSIFSGRSPQAAVRQAAQRPWLAPYTTDVEAWERFASRVRQGQAQGAAHDVR